MQAECMHTSVQYHTDMPSSCHLSWICFPRQALAESCARTTRTSILHILTFPVESHAFQSCYSRQVVAKGCALTTPTTILHTYYVNPSESVAADRLYWSTLSCRSAVSAIDYCCQQGNELGPNKCFALETGASLPITGCPCTTLESAAPQKCYCGIPDEAMGTFYLAYTMDLPNLAAIVYYTVVQKDEEPLHISLLHQ